MRSAPRPAPHAVPQRDRPGLAALTICVGVALASGMDAVVKFLSGDYPVHQLMAVRCLIAVPLLGLFALWAGGFAPLAPRQRRMVLFRGLIMGSSYVAFAMSLASLPMASGVAIYFTMPLFVAALAGPMLGEHVPLYRWLAIAAGFAGVLLMIRPGAETFEPAALLALYAALGYAVGQLVTRSLAATVAAPALAFWQNVVYLAIALVLAAGFGLAGGGGEGHKSIAFLTRGWVMPPPADMALMAATGLLSASAMVLFSQSYRLGEANFVAPFEYSNMLWAVAWGVLLFADMPDWITLAGAATVAAAGLFMLSRNRRPRVGAG